jgi:hypothetical protein
MAAITTLGLIGAPAPVRSFAAKAEAGLPPVGKLIEEFDLWRQGYGGVQVWVYKAGTTDLARLFADETLTVAAANPQVLLSRSDSLGATYGKFAASLYTPDAYTLDIRGSEQTGIQRPPLTTLAGEDASLTFVRAKDGAADRPLRERFADTVAVLDFGKLDTAPDSNAAVISAAIAQAAARGGGRVVLPPGVWPVTQIAVPQSVLLAGQGRGVTILQSQFAGRTVTINGDDAGLADLTLDGINLVPGSVGIFAKARRRLVLDNVEVKRFQTSLFCQGGRDHVYRRLYLTNGTWGARLHGDSDVASTTAGDEFSGLDWFQGAVAQMTTTGVELAINDLEVRHNAFHQVDFTDCPGLAEAVAVSGAAWTTFRQCYWANNGVALKVEDAADTSLGFHEVVSLRIDGGQIVGTETIPTRLVFDGLCESVMFEHVEVIDADVELNVPVNPILWRDVTEDATELSGETVKLARWRTGSKGTVAGTTSSATAVTVWKERLEPNEVVIVTARATAEQINGAGYAAWSLTQAARCAPATLGYDNQTANFTVGQSVTGLTSGATGIIVADSDSGSLGTLSLADVAGEFIDNELIKEDIGTGQAQVNGVLVYGSAALVGAATEQLKVGSNTGNPPSGWAVAVAVNGREVRIDVTGAASTNVAWTVEVALTRL